MSICQSNSWHDRVWVLSVITQSKEKKKMEFSCHFSELIQHCVSQPSLNTCCTTKHTSLYGEKASLCVPSLLSHRTTSGFSPSSVPRPLVKKKCGKLSKGTWSKLCVKTPKPVPGTHWSFLTFPLHRLFSNSRDAQTFPLRYFWTLCRF